MQGKRRTKVGRVVSDGMDKTVVVSVERLRRHPIYKRVVRLSSKFKAHDEANDARVGDTVRIEESRPLSRDKRWRVTEIVARGSGEVLVDATEDAIVETSADARVEATEDALVGATEEA